MKPFIIGTDNPSNVAMKAITEIKKRQGTVDHVIGKTKFVVSGFEGSWRKIDGGIEVTIDKKPFLMRAFSDETIEKRVREYFATAGT